VKRPAAQENKTAFIKCIHDFTVYAYLSQHLFVELINTIKIAVTIYHNTINSAAEKNKHHNLGNRATV